MKKLFLLSVLLINASFSNAQMDERFYFPGKVWESFDTIPHQSFTHVFDGDTVTSYLLLPANRKKSPTTVFYCHGAGGNVSSYIRFIQPLLEEGIQVYLMDFRGYGKSTGTPTHLNIAADGQQLFDFARTLPEVRKTQLVVMGVSMGTQIAAHLARANEEHVHALVLDGCISSFTEIALAYAPPEYHANIQQSLVSPYSAKEDVAFLKTIPVLFIYSFGDKEVPASESQKVVAACGAPATVFQFDGGHIMAPISDRERYIQHIRELLKSKRN
jgi:pimeloyl-ACP methyl ester carboxylesterase